MKGWLKVRKNFLWLAWSCYMIVRTFAMKGIVVILLLCKWRYISLCLWNSFLKIPVRMELLVAGRSVSISQWGCVFWAWWGGAYLNPDDIHRGQGRVVGPHSVSTCPPGPPHPLWHRVKNSSQSSLRSSCLHQIQRQVIPHQAQPGRRQHWQGHIEPWKAGEWGRESSGRGRKVAWCWRWTQRGNLARVYWPKLLIKGLRRCWQHIKDDQALLYSL